MGARTNAGTSRRRAKVLLAVLGGAAVLLSAACLGISSHYSIPAGRVPPRVAQIAAGALLATWHAEDEIAARRMRRGYWVGLPDRETDPIESWARLGGRLAGFEYLGGDPGGLPRRDVPFVYESPEAPHLAALRQRYRLDEVVSGPGGEYEALLRLGAWVGTRFDHGESPLPGGTENLDPVALVEAGRSGGRFLCHIAAKLTVHAATSLGWGARLGTASRTPYDAEHGYPEVWSNELEKWLVLDTDYNVVWEADGRPLSGFELCHEGPELRKRGLLRRRRFAPAKPGATDRDLLPYYAYVHVDLRNDWYSRRLAPGSPAGGDRSTFWSARPSLLPVLTDRERVDDPARYDWPVTSVALSALSARRGPAVELLVEVGLSGYSPFFEAFELSTDGGPWRRTTAPRVTLRFDTEGEHRVAARVATVGPFAGPAREVRFRWAPSP